MSEETHDGTDEHDQEARRSAPRDRAPARVSLIGLGRMGTQMAARLLAAGFAVTGFDLSPDARDRASRLGADTVVRVEDAFRDAEIVITMLPDSIAVEAVLRSEQVRRSMRPGMTIIDMSSSEPTRTRALAAALQPSGVVFIDAPVSGGVSGATAGTLTIMVGGPDEIVERLSPVLSAMGTVRHAGPLGAGHAVKALNNLLSATHLLATCEAISAARRFGLDIDRVLEIINASSGRSWSSQYKWPTFIEPETYDSGFGLRLMLKDVHIAVDLLTMNGAERALAESTLAAWSRAAHALPEGADHTEVARWVEGPVPSPHEGADASERLAVDESQT